LDASGSPNVALPGMAGALQSDDMTAMRNFVILALVLGGALIALSPRRRAQLARKLAESRRFVSRRIVDRDARDRAARDR
jgi:hypothetical protein